MKLHKACTTFRAELTLSDGLTVTYQARSLSALHKKINTFHSISDIDDYIIREFAYYEIIPEDD